MSRPATGRPESVRAARVKRGDCAEISRRLWQSTCRDVPLPVFLQETAYLLLDFSGCDVVELWLRRPGRCVRIQARRGARRALTVETFKADAGHAAELLHNLAEGPVLREVCRLIWEQRDTSAWPCFTRRGAFWTGNWRRTAADLRSMDPHWVARLGRHEGAYESHAIVPLRVTGETTGLLHLRSVSPDGIGESQVECLEDLSGILAVGWITQLGQSALRERIKELTCLHRLVQVGEQPGLTLAEILQSIAELLPTAWQYPDVAAAEIVLDGRRFATATFGRHVPRQSAALVVKGTPRGRVEVAYTAPRPEIDEGPFLKEERSLIDMVAAQIAVIIERRESAEERQRLQDQLRHAERLATIGQLAAGVAHELNEPLGNILAFAQLVQKQPALPGQTQADVAKIVRASLQAREIIRNLMLFSRQMPPQQTQVDLNSVIAEGLAFLESRCRERGVAVVRRLSNRLPRITADSSQLLQVLVNLVINAVQAMPGGGKLTIATRQVTDHVVWVVADNGSGMAPDVLNNIFLPFYTTKDVGEGTGLGLPVVHGIITAHHGTIAVRSMPDKGTRFEIHLPVTIVPPDQEGPNS